MTIALDHLIEQEIGIRGGRPRIAGTRITVDDIVIMHLRLGQPVPQIAAKYRLPPASVHAALAFYFSHKPEIDRRLFDDDAFVEAFKLNHPSRLVSH
jgi:uncharacterized protein (DUF433 family)